MKVVKKERTKEIVLNEVQRAIAAQFIAMHNEKFTKQELRKDREEERLSRRID